MANKILVIDFGSQYNQLIVRRIREMGVYSELVSSNIDLNRIKNDPTIKGIIFSGGPNSVYEKGAPTIGTAIYDLGLPILGICYGMQLIAKHFQGKVVKCAHREYGKALIKIKAKNPLIKGLSTTEQV
jgi:GMP synthase (glutamine-hydrolysing)